MSIATKESMKISILTISALVYMSVFSMDNSHFYRASYFNGEPRFAKNGLFSGDITIGGGKTCTARNNCGKKIPLLDLYGPQKLQFLGENVPSLDENNNLDALLIALMNNPKSPDFATLSVGGHFHIVEQNISLYQNFCHGFFVHAYLPFRELTLNTIKIHDCTSQPTAAWRNFLQNFDAILARYNLRIKSFSKQGMGDLSLLAGWTINHEETEYLDFVDVSLQTGILVPTGKKKSRKNILDIPLGYNGHYALPLIIDASLGLYEWLTLGAHGDCLIFFNRNACNHIKTSNQTNGFIKLATAPTRVSSGTLSNFGLYVKADHFMSGASLLIGYNYSRKNRDTLAPLTSGINWCYAQSDATLRGWRMHTLNLIAEYDFATETHPAAPRIGFIYNGVLAGKRVFTTSIFGGYLGLDFAWCF